jgi:hypothetical protein
MSLRRAPLLVSLCLLAAGLSLPSGTQPAVARAAGKAGAAAAGLDKDKDKGKGWVDYQSPEGLYKARFPGPPQAEVKDGVPKLITARYQTVGGLNAGPMYYVSAMVGKSQNTPPVDMLQQLLTTAEKQGFQALGIVTSDSKPIKDPQGNPGRRLTLTHSQSHRVGIGKIVVNKLTGQFLLVAGFGPDAEAFVKSAQFL